MPASARAIVAFGLFLAAPPQAMASEAPRFDPAQFVVADTSGAPLRLGVAPGVGPSPLSRTSIGSGGNGCGTSRRPSSSVSRFPAAAPSRTGGARASRW